MMQMQRRKRKVGVGLILAFVAMVGFGVAPHVQANATEPSPSGSYSPVYYETYYPESGDPGDSDAHSSKIRVWKMSSDGSTSHDWYLVGNIMRQLEIDYWYDYPNFWVYVGEYDSAYPDLVDWDPGTRSIGGDDIITFDVSASGPSVSFSASWDMDWGGQWQIARQGSTSPEDWNYVYHQEYFHTKFWNGDSRKTDWDKLSFGSTWKVSQGEPVVLWLASAVKYCEGGWDCWDGPNKWEESGLHSYWLNDSATCMEEGEIGEDDDRCVATVEVPPVTTALIPEFPALDQCRAEKLFPDCDPDTPEIPPV